MFCAQSIWVVHHRHRDATNHNIRRQKYAIGIDDSLLCQQILKHLPSQYPKKHNRSWKPERSCAGRWLTTRGHIVVHHYRSRLDRLEVYDMKWSTYDDHRAVHPFQLINTYSGWLIRGKGWCAVIYLGLKRQFGFVQDIPIHPLDVPEIPKEMLATVLKDPRLWFYSD
ncbi:hypothetical protein MTR_8g011090 [Medicago truncatula]|uniref:Uncharacterized protein n=1 Tax=Medicago truncatula TaxID=3880 RepID=G7LDH9_MEDTR|nr:hypothetical protein MTR_8g011090 [Medicago truncatula]